MLPTLRETWTQYFELRRATWQPRTVYTRGHMVRRFIVLLEERYPHVRSFADLRRHPHIEAWLAYLRPLHPVTRRDTLLVLDQFFRDLIEWEWPEAPLRRLLEETDLPSIPQRLPKPFSPEDDRRLQLAMEEDDSVMGLGLRLLRQTGLRVGELLGLPLDAAVQNHEGFWELTVPPGKTFTERLFPLTPQTVSIIAAIRRRRGLRASQQPLPPLLMIAENGEPVRYWNVLRHIKGLARRAGLSHWESVHPHQLRHTFATELARTGMPMPTLMALLGHKRPEMTMRYVRLTATDIRQVYECALAKLTALPSFPAPAKPFPRGTPPASLRDDFHALIARLDYSRRDARGDPARAAALARLVKRLRAALRAFKHSA